MNDEPLIRGDATPEARWLPWLAAAQLAPLPAARWRAADRLVVVAPHPDDEVLACGGLLAAHHRAGGEIAIVAVTDGEASHPDDPRWTPARLAAARRDESRRGLARLGIGGAAVTRLALPDGDVDAQRARLQQALRWILRTGDRVVTTWRGDGHPDHDATALAVAEICGERGCHLLEAPVWMWHWAEPGDARVPWHRLRRLPLAEIDRQAKIEALREHASQLAARSGGRGAVLDAAIVERAGREVEHVFV